MMKLTLAICTACLLSVVFERECNAQSQKRTWRTARTENILEAEFVEVVDNKAKLRKTDGNTLLVDLNQLSLFDLKYIKSFLSEPTKAPDTYSERKVLDVSPDVVDEDVVAFGPSDEPKLELKGQWLQLAVPAVPSVWLGYATPYHPSKVCVSNLRTGQSFKEFNVDHPIDNHGLSISPDGKIIAISDNGKINVYTRAGKKRCTIAVKSYFTTVLPTAQRLVVLSSTAGESAIYDPDTGVRIQKLDAEIGSKEIHSVSLGTSQIAAYCSNKDLKLFDFNTGNLVSSKLLDFLDVSAMGYSRDGKQLFVVEDGVDTVLHVYDAKSLEEFKKYPLNIKTPFSTNYKCNIVEEFQGQNALLLFGQYVVDRETGQLLWNKERPHDREANPAGLIADNRQLWIAKRNNGYHLELEDIPWKELAAAQEALKEDVASAEDLKEDPLAALKSLNKNFDGYRQHELILADQPSEWIGRWESQSNTLTVHNLITGELRTLVGEDASDAVLGRDGETIACKSSDNLSVYSLSTGKKLWDSSFGRLEKVLYLGTDQLIVLAGDSVRVLNTANGQEINRFPVDFKAHLKVVISPNNKSIAGFNWDRSSLLAYDLASGLQKRSWNDLKSKDSLLGIQDFCYCSNGTQLAVFIDKLVRIYDVETQELIATTPNIAKSPNLYRTGPIAQALAGSKKWLIVGAVVYDGDKNVIESDESAVFMDPHKWVVNQRMVDNSRQLRIVREKDSLRAEIRDVRKP